MTNSEEELKVLNKVAEENKYNRWIMKCKKIECMVVSKKDSPGYELIEKNSEK